MELKKDGLARLITSRFVGPLAVALAVMVLVVSEGGRLQLSSINDNRESSIDTQLAAGKLRRTLLMMESSKRGYMLTGRDVYLTPYREQIKPYEQALADVEKVAGTDIDQHDTLLKLAELARRKRSEMEEVLRRFDSGDRDGAYELMLTDLGREQMVQISALVDEVLREESGSYDAFSVQRDRVNLWSRAGIWLMVGLCIAGAAAMMRLARENEQERAIHLLQLHAERDRLDEEVARRTAEVEELARHMERVREDERARLARELHDELGGLLTAAKLDVARLRKRIQDPTGTKQQLLEHMGETLDAGIALKRRIIEDLRPSSLANLGLQRTLEIQCAEFAQRAELKVQAAVEDVRLPADHALAVYRLVQEALTNVAKYAKASQVRVVLQRVGGQVEVLIEDDGVGFDLYTSAAAGGHGLQGMRFRIRACGGDVQVRSAPGQGTTVRAMLGTT